LLLYQTVLFDLDGTLIESAPGIFACARAVMQEMGLPPMTDAQLRPMVGPPLAVCFSDVIGVPKDRVQEAVDRYHLLAKTVGLDAIHPYPGIPALLAGLKAAGACVCVVTSKVTPTAQAHLERYGLAPFIDRLWGGIPGGSAEKTFLLQTALDALHAKKTSIVMVGDRHYDLRAAQAVGIPSIGVLYGYGSAEEIASCAPTHTAATVETLGRLLLSGSATLQ
jgi:phosphoglycolate phosphatase